LTTAGNSHLFTQREQVNIAAVRSVCVMALQIRHSCAPIAPLVQLSPFEECPLAALASSRRRLGVVPTQRRCRLTVSRKDNAMPGPAEVVRELCSGIDQKDLAAVEALLDEKVVYHNIGHAPAVGREATLDALRFQFDLFEPIAFKIRNSWSPAT
jgi:hypothetical protein